MTAGPAAELAVAQTMPMRVLRRSAARIIRADLSSENDCRGPGLEFFCRACPAEAAGRGGHYNGDFGCETGIIATQGAERLSARGAESSAPDERGDDMASTNGTIKRLVHDKGFGFIAAGRGRGKFLSQ